MSLRVRNCREYQKSTNRHRIQIPLGNDMTLGFRTCLRSNTNQVPLLCKNFFTSHAPGRKMGLNLFSATNLQCQLFNVHSHLLSSDLLCKKNQGQKMASFTFSRLSPLQFVNYFWESIHNAGVAGVVEKISCRLQKIPTTCVICRENLLSYHRWRVSIFKGGNVGSDHVSYSLNNVIRKSAIFQS